MAFNFFKRKKEVIDFTKQPEDTGGIPTNGYLKRKAPSNNSSYDSSSALPSATSTQTSSQSSNTGGFDFFGNPLSGTPTSPYSSSSSSVSDSSDLSSLKTQVEDVSYKLSRIMDRLELVEKKIDRLERRNGISE